MKLDVVQGGRDSWLEHGYTKAQRERSAKDAHRFLKLLLSTCASSNDPAVLRAYFAYAVQERIVELLGVEERNDDGDPK